jgi:hypothetical protein
MPGFAPAHSGPRNDAGTLGFFKAERAGRWVSPVGQRGARLLPGRQPPGRLPSSAVRQSSSRLPTRAQTSGGLSLGSANATDVGISFATSETVERPQHCSQCLGSYRYCRSLGPVWRRAETGGEQRRRARSECGSGSVRCNHPFCDGHHTPKSMARDQWRTLKVTA